MYANASSKHKRNWRSENNAQIYSIQNVQWIYSFICREMCHSQAFVNNASAWTLPWVPRRSRSSPRGLRSSLAARGASDSGHGKLESPVNLQWWEPGTGNREERARAGRDRGFKLTSLYGRARSRDLSYDAGGMLWKCNISVRVQ